MGDQSKPEKVIDSIKEDLKTIKLYTSSLFARKCNYMVVVSPTECIFTTMTDEQVRSYRVGDIVYVLHYVNFNSPEFVELLWKYFPRWKNKQVSVNLRFFSSLISKATLDTADKDLRYIDNLIEHKTQVVNRSKTDKTKVPAIVARMLSPEMVELYNSFKKEYDREKDEDIVYKTHWLEKDLSMVDRSAITYLTVKGEYFDENFHDLNIPVQDGTCHVSLSEYGKKSKLPYECKAELKYRQNNCLSIYNHFKDDDLTVLSIRPIERFFPFKRK